MDEASDEYCLRWNKHVSTLLFALEHLFQTEAFTDVTLICDGRSIKCHKVILVACSSYFQQVFLDNNSPQPVIILKDILFSEVTAILEYMYKGVVHIGQVELAGFLKAAETLKVKGLFEEQQRTKEDEDTLLTTNLLYSASSSPSYGRNPDNFSTYENVVNSTSCCNWKEFDGSNIAKCSKPNRVSNSPILRTALALDRQGPLCERHAKAIINYSLSNGDTSSTTSSTNGNESNYKPLFESLDAYHSLSLATATTIQESLMATNKKRQWKPYKQYSQQRLTESIETVRRGMATYKAAQLHGVPARTLYDAVKKLGIRSPNRTNPKRSFPGSSNQDHTIKMTGVFGNIEESQGVISTVRPGNRDKTCSSAEASVSSSSKPHWPQRS